MKYKQPIKTVVKCTKLLIKTNKITKTKTVMYVYSLCKFYYYYIKMIIINYYYYYNFVIYVCMSIMFKTIKTTNCIVLLNKNKLLNGA